MNPEDLMDAPVNAGDKRQLKEKAERDLARELEREGDLRAVLAMPQGRRAIVQILNICGWAENPYNPNASIHAATSGRRMIAKQIVDWIRQIQPDGFQLWSAVDAEWQSFRYPIPVKKKR